MVRVLDNMGQTIDDALAVRYGATAKDWEAAADQPEADVEFIDGVLIMHAAVNVTYARRFNFLFELLNRYVRARDLGEVFAEPFSMDIALERKFQPDIMFLTHATRGNLGEDRLHGPADFAIEIASPSTRRYDRGKKRECYEQGGVREYWMVDPYDELVRVDQPAGTPMLETASGKVACQACPGFFIHAEWLWQDPLPDVDDCLAELLADGS